MLLKDGTFVVAEVGLAHMGQVKLAEWFIDNLQQADAVKFQVYTTENLIDQTRDPERYERFKERELGYYEITHLKSYAESKGLKWFASAHTMDWLVRLSELDVFAYKIGSGERDNSALIDFALQTGKPVLISTGLRNHHQALATLKRFQKRNVVIMHTVTQYPTERPNLNFIHTLKQENLTLGFNLRGSLGAAESVMCEIGYSCHAVGYFPCVLAVAMGATVIEKHVKHPESMGQDGAGALYPDEFNEMVDEITDVEEMLGSFTRENNEEERKNESWALKGKDGKRPYSSAE